MDFEIHLISCSNPSKIGLVKKSEMEMPNPSQNFLIVIIDISRLFSSNILYAVEGVTPEIFANSLILIFLSLQIC